MSNEIVNWEEKFAAEAKAVAALERPALGSIGFRGGVLTYAGNEIESGKLSGVALAYSVEHTYYAGEFDPDHMTGPDCFAQASPEAAGRDGLAMVPHENSPSKQSEACAGCPQLEWGSSPKGKGKACKQIRRIAFIPWADDMTPELVASAELGIAKIPVTSVKNWKEYINAVSAKYSRPTWAVVTELSVKNHAKYQFTVNFKEQGIIEDSAVLAALNARIPDVQGMLLTPYTYDDDDGEASDNKASAKSGKKKY